MLHVTQRNHTMHMFAEVIRNGLAATEPRSESQHPTVAYPARELATTWGPELRKDILRRRTGLQLFRESW